ncbi:TPA: hypothetical protein MJB25_01785 [Klebsiella pneumoniae]|nr:hypothetical protein [Klebsiella pneumoniae]HBZ0475176.1 hypothetical protein [Klebsiella pneumoniae]HBZ1063216.1 hypothetical protein [Klebsiella pneumoniae]
MQYTFFISQPAILLTVIYGIIYDLP